MQGPTEEHLLVNWVPCLNIIIIIIIIIVIIIIISIIIIVIIISIIIIIIVIIIIIIIIKVKELMPTTQVQTYICFRIWFCVSSL